MMEQTTYHLLNFNLLERAEPARASLHVERVVDIVLLALILVLAVEYRVECLARDILKRFRAANITGIRVHKQQRLDFRHPRDNAPYSDEMAKVHATDLTDGHREVRTERLEIEVADTLVTKGLSEAEERYALSSQEVFGEAVLCTLSLRIAFPALVQNNVNDFVLVADIFCRPRHEAVYDFAEKVDITPSIVPNVADQATDAPFVLDLTFSNGRNMNIVPGWHTSEISSKSMTSIS